jgi:hypothetical protein
LFIPISYPPLHFKQPITLFLPCLDCVFLFIFFVVGVLYVSFSSSPLFYDEIDEQEP